jgi:hypothetical protein
MTAFANDRQEMGRIAALEAALDAAEHELHDLRAGWDDLKRAKDAAARALADVNEKLEETGKDLDSWHEIADNARKVAANALAAKAQAEEDAHYANGVTDLALQRRDTAEAQVAVLASMLREVLYHGLIYWEPNTARGNIAKADMQGRIDILLESLPDSAVKMRAVAEAAERVCRAWNNEEDSEAVMIECHEANAALDAAVAAYKASRTGEDEQEDKPWLTSTTRS